jgi:hypothetical protein
VTGRVVALEVLDRLAEEQILTPLRYRNLNQEIDAFRTAVPTTENLAFEIDRRLRSAWKTFFGDAGPGLERVRIWETERNICEIAIIP